MSNSQKVETVEEFLARGGKIEIIPHGVTAADVEEGKRGLQKRMVFGSKKPAYTEIQETEIGHLA